MKNSKTTIKELTRQYRSVLKKCLFLNAIALGLFAATSANAAEEYADKNLSNITDAGKTVIVNAVTAENGIIKTAAQEFIQTTAANVEADQLGWNITSSPDEEDGSSFAQRLEAGFYDDLTVEGGDRTVIGALNKIGEFIGTENTAAEGEPSNATGVYKLFEVKQDWVDATLGIESKNEDAVKTALTGPNADNETSIVGAINALDNAIGDMSEFADNNYATSTESVAANLTALDTAIGDMSEFADNNYATSTESVAANLTALDSQVKTNADNIAQEVSDRITGDATTLASANTYTDTRESVIRSDFALGDARTLTDAKHYTDIRYNELDRKIDKLEDKMEKGLAANAALAGLVPLSNAHKTQLSAAMGGYGSNQALAIGGFHYLNDQTLLNVGGAYGGNSDISYKVGVTFGF